MILKHKLFQQTGDEHLQLTAVPSSPYFVASSDPVQDAGLDESQFQGSFNGPMIGKLLGYSKIQTKARVAASIEADFLS